MTNDSNTKSATTTKVPKTNLDKALDDLKNVVNTKLDSKTQRLMTQWLKEWAGMIDREKSGFDPKKMMTYKPGDIVSVNFGFNVGSEQGGRRPAVVIEDNARSDRNVMIVPLSTFKGSKSDIKDTMVYLGVIEDFNLMAGKAKGTQTVAMVNQMRTVSKIRITRPQTKNDGITRIDPSDLKRVYEKITDLYASKGLNRPPKE